MFVIKGPWYSIILRFTNAKPTSIVAFPLLYSAQVAGPFNGII